ncbi:sulfatase-like hydrolase/transferase [bacterium]|nr:sulfatase-like hydrolase/transferase [bacterium]
MTNTLNRRNYLRLSTAAAAGAALQPWTACGQPKKPNIVYIIADDMGWADIGYNNEEIKTPNLDRLAAQGVTLTHHYAMPTCTPTRVGLMTGHFPSRYGVHGPDYGKIFRDDTITLADAMQKAGYFTAISGKWHMGSPPKYTPLKYGFDSSYGYFAGQIDPYTHHYKKGQLSWHRDDALLKEEGHATDLITEEAMRVIDKSDDKPFFLYVAYSVPHFPLKEPERWTSMYAHIEEPSRRWFNASITHMDHGIGQIVEALDRKGIREDTLIVFVSDNGGQKSWHSKTQYKGRYADKPHTVLGNNEPLRGWKGDVYEGGIRVPGFVNWKGTVDSGKCSTPIHIADWMPTLCALAGCSMKRDLQWDGANVWPQLSGKKHNPPERPLYWKTRNAAAVRQDGWKLVQTGQGEQVELYHIAKDPLEKKNVAKEKPGKVKELKRVLQQMMAKDGEKEKE